MANGKGKGLPITDVTIGEDNIRDATVIDLTQGGKSRIYVVIEKIDPKWAGKIELPACCVGPLVFLKRR